MTNPNADSPQPVPQVVVQAAGRSNGMGTAGFVISLVGLVLFCGLLSPLGLIFSLIGLGKEPRGLAIAGTVIGIIGSIWLPLMGLAMIGAAVGFGAVAEEAGKVLETTESIMDAASVIEEQRADEGSLPGPVEGNRRIAGLNDAWGKPLRYERVDGSFLIRSAGPDKTFDTSDDLTSRGDTDD